MHKPAVLLKVASGRMAGATYVFDKPTICVLGRGDSCFPRLPNDEHHKDVSRYHCLLIINPPQICIQDLGSCNGTFVNGERLSTELFLESTIASLQRIPSARFPLEPGDHFALGQDATFQVAIIEGSLLTANLDDSATFERAPERPELEDAQC